MTNGSAHLDYAPPPKWHQRRWFRRAIIILILACVAWQLYQLLEWGWRRGTILWQERQALSHVYPPERSIKEPAPDKFQSQLLAGQFEIELFVHGRRATDSSPRRLVVVGHDFHSRWRRSLIPPL